MILIAESGATKTQWALVNDDKSNVLFDSQGINPFFLTVDQLSSLLLAEFPEQVKTLFVDKVFFYGAGCHSSMNKNLISEGVKSIFPYADVEVQSDLLAAARALYKHNAGLAAILGTGSNVCQYDGQRIVGSIKSLGYVLGDEGSGAFIGKQVLSSFLLGKFPSELASSFQAQFPFTLDQFLQGVYKSEFPSRYLGQFCQFASDNQKHPFIALLVNKAFNLFYEVMVSQLNLNAKQSIGFVGGVANGFKDVLIKCTHQNGFDTPLILKNCLQQLLDYHYTS
jgi:N-acetylglucosamine kinase-like BadF-type ATPase